MLDDLAEPLCEYTFAYLKNGRHRKTLFLSLSALGRAHGTLYPKKITTNQVLTFLSRLEDACVSDALSHKPKLFMLVFKATSACSYLTSLLSVCLPRLIGSDLLKLNQACLQVLIRAMLDHPADQSSKWFELFQLAKYIRR